MLSKLSTNMVKYFLFSYLIAQVFAFLNGKNTIISLSMVGFPYLSFSGIIRKIPDPKGNMRLEYAERHIQSNLIHPCCSCFRPHDVVVEDCSYYQALRKLLL